MFKQGVLAASILAAMAAGSASAVTVDELQAQIKAQQVQLEALAAQVEKQQSGATGGEWFKNTTVGGYGEAHFYHYDNLSPSQPVSDVYDAYRFVLYVGHKFSDTVRLQSELEVEHAFVADTDTQSGTIEKKPGEVELEQMFLEWNYAGQQKLSVGQMLVPVGILNETHEPDTFYGVNRNRIENDIIPTTWWEGGIKASGEIGAGFSYDAMVSTGLKNSSGSVRDGRQKGAKAVAEDLAYTGRVKYTGLPGLEVGLTYHEQADISQSNAANSGDEAELYEAHVAYQVAGFGLRALYAKWDIDGLSLGNAAAKQEGFYIEPSYKIGEKLGVFARYSEWDKAAGDGANSEFTQYNWGVNFYPAPRAVLKLDIQDRNHPNGQAAKDEDGFALGMGYSF